MRVLLVGMRPRTVAPLGKYANQTERGKEGENIMAHRGVLRHCLMAGLCSAAEKTEELTDAYSSDTDERTRLGGAKHRCPYETPSASASVSRNRNGTLDTATLHCERLWVEAIS